MNIKIFIAPILLLGLLSAGNITTNITNTTYNMLPNECITLQLNDTNTTFCAIYQMKNITIELEYNQNYTTSENITVNSPPRNSCVLNRTVNLSGGASVFYADQNLTVNCETHPLCPTCQNTTCQTCTSCLQNVTMGISSGGTFTNAVCNITVFGNPIPKLNRYSNMSYGERFDDEIRNVSLICPSKPIIGASQQICNGSEYRNNEYGIYISSCAKTECPTCQTCQTCINTTCPIFKISDYPELINVSELRANATKNCTSTMKIENQTYCSDSLKNLCEPSDLLGGNIKACIEKIFMSYQVQLNQSQKDLGLCNIEKKACVEGSKNNTELADSMKELGYYASIIIGVACIIGAVIIYVYRTKRGEVKQR